MPLLCHKIKTGRRKFGLFCPRGLFSLSHVNWFFSFINWNKGPIYGPTGISFLWVGIYIYIYIYILLKCVGVLIKLKCIKNKFLYQRKNIRKKKKNLSMFVLSSHTISFSPSPYKPAKFCSNRQWCFQFYLCKMGCGPFFTYIPHSPLHRYISNCQ